MHFTPRPFWLMIVSTATLVLPVLRSPMMSSRWPRPIGVMASITLMPVWSGSFTGWRSTMPGAWISMRRICSEATGPLPSMGSPRGFTTRPSNPSPTGMERIRPVDLTPWPSSMCWASPRMTDPMVSSSRLRARPSTPPSNSSSSFTEAWGRPLMRAMPSPTSTIRPIWDASTTGLKSARRRLMTDAISDGSRVKVMGAFQMFSERLAELLEAVAHGPVHDGVADPGEDAAQHIRVHHLLDRHPLAGGPVEGLGQPALLVVVERDGRAHLGHLFQAL